MQFLIIFPAMLLGLAFARPHPQGGSAGVVGFCVSILFPSLIRSFIREWRLADTQSTAHEYTRLRKLVLWVLTGPISNAVQSYSSLYDCTNVGGHTQYYCVSKFQGGQLTL